jgi:hypothetical protein
MMQLLRYNKKKKILTVKFSSHTVWEYPGVDAESYKFIKKAKNRERAVRTVLRRLLIVGENKKG